MKLELTTRGVKSGAEFTDTRKGYVKIMTNSKEKMPFIVIDAFEGQGSSYKELEFPEVRVYNKNTALIFKGTFNQLSDLIEDAKSIAEAIRADLNQEEGINDNDTIDYEQYKRFSEKY